MTTESHPKDDRTIVKAQLTSKPTRAPSMKQSNKRRNQDNALSGGATLETRETDADEIHKQKPMKEADKAYKSMQVTTVMDQLYTTLRDLFSTLADTRLYNIIHIRPNDTQEENQFDMKRVKAQVHSFMLPELIMRCEREYSNYYDHAEFLLRYDRLVQSLQIDGTKQDSEQVNTVITTMNWTDAQAFVGHEKVWLSYETWKELEDGLRAAEKKERNQERENRDMRHAG